MEHIGVDLTPRPTRITFADMRDMGVRGLLIYCADYRCSHSCGKRGADVRPDFNWDGTATAMMGYR